MTRSLLAIAALLCASLPAAAANNAPVARTFGIGAFFAGNPANGAAGMTPGLNASFWAADQLELHANLALVSVENSGTSFSIIGGLQYYLLKNLAEDFGVFLAANGGVNVVSPSNADSTTALLLQFGGGGEYYVSRHLSVSISEGLQLSTKPTTFGFVTALGVHLYF